MPASSSIAETPDAAAEDSTRGILLILLSSFTFALMNAIVKLTSARLGPVEIGFFRQVFSLIPVIGVVIHQGGPAILKTRRPVGHLFRGMIGNSAMIIFFLSVSRLPLADANALSFASPLFVTALSLPLLGEAVGKHRWSAVAVGFVGVLVMTNPSAQLSANGSGFGAGMGVLAAFMSGLMSITIRQLNKTEQPVTIVFYFATIGTIFFGILVTMFWVAPNPREWAGLIVIGFIGGFSQLIMTSAYRHAPASILAPFGYSSILWSTLFGYLIWNDLPGSRVLIGSAIVILSGLYIIYRETRKKAEVIAEPLSQAI